MANTADSKKRIGFFGPSGTFTEIAAKKYSPDAELIPYDTITEVFGAVKKDEVLEGVVPIENLLNGHVLETLDCLYKNGVKIKQAVVIPIEQSLVALPETQKIDIVMSHPQALAQCSDYLRENCKGAKIEKSESTASAMKMIADNHLVGAASIGTALGAEKYGLKIIKKNIANKEVNKTMFVVISKKPAKKAEHNRTSIAISPHSDRPGLLRDILNAFAENKINLEMIQSRPDGEGSYIFYIDLDGHPEDINVKAAFETINEKLNGKLEDVIKILGSYPYTSLSKS